MDAVGYFSRLCRAEGRPFFMSAIQSFTPRVISPQELLAAYLGDKAATSQRVLLSSLNAIARSVNPDSNAAQFDWGQLRYRHTAIVRMLLSQRVTANELSPATVNRHLSALRGILKTAWRMGLIQADEYQRATDLKSMKYEALPAGRVLEPAELDRLFEYCLSQSNAVAARDAAMLVLLRSGARRAEVVGLDLADIDTTTGAVSIRFGKGQKSRVSYYPIAFAPIIDRWIERRGRKAGPFLHPIYKGGKIRDTERLSPQAVLWLLGKIQEKVGLADLSPHDFRRTFITELAEAGVDMTVSQRLSGHADVKTHQRYDRRGEDSKKAAVQHLHVSGNRSIG